MCIDIFLKIKLKIDTHEEHVQVLIKLQPHEYNGTIKHAIKHMDCET